MIGVEKIYNVWWKVNSRCLLHSPLQTLLRQCNHDSSRVEGSVGNRCSAFLSHPSMVRRILSLILILCRLTIVVVKCYTRKNKKIYTKYSEYLNWGPAGEMITQKYVTRDHIEKHNCSIDIFMKTKAYFSHRSIREKWNVTFTLNASWTN